MTDQLPFSATFMLNRCKILHDCTQSIKTKTFGFAHHLGDIWINFFFVKFLAPSWWFASLKKLLVSWLLIWASNKSTHDDNTFKKWKYFFSLYLLNIIYWFKSKCLVIFFVILMPLFWLIILYFFCLIIKFFFLDLFLKLVQRTHVHVQIWTDLVNGFLESFIKKAY